jgi:glutamate/tyrosine decarboxylase-like PLP-dependent enzyme
MGDEGRATVDPLGLDPEEMRRLGYRTVDLLVDGLSRLDGQPVLLTATPEAMAERLHEPPPAGPELFENLLTRLAEEVLPFAARWDHPRMFGYIPGSGTWPGALGDLIASAWNVDASSWRESAGPNRLELTVLDWFRTWVGYPPSASGILLSGGSAANLTALACAREALAGSMDDRLVAYVSDQAHSSLARAARVLGFRPDQVRVLPTDERFRMRIDALEGAIDADLRAGRRPLFVAAAAGSTNTGSVDPLSEIAELCRERRIWLHVDGAYGGFAVLSERGRRELAGIELADSLTLDPHKWLYQPFECGCVLVRDGELLRRAFEIVPDYLRDAHGDEGEVSFSERGLQLTRSSRALKVWLSIRSFGLDAFRTAIDRAMDLAQLAQERIEVSEELEVMTPATLGVVTFRRRFGGGHDEPTLVAMNGELVRRLAEDGFGLVSSTRLRGRTAIRMVPMNHTTRREDVLGVLEWLERAPITAEVGPEPPARDRESGVWLPWISAAGIDALAVRAVPLFRTLSGKQAEELAAAIRLSSVEPGEEVIRQWEGSRDLFVVMDGTAEVTDSGAVLRELGPGDVFGEVAALEWGAEFGYARTATVTALSPMRVLQIPQDALRTLLPAAPEVAEELHRLAQRRLLSSPEQPGAEPFMPQRGEQTSAGQHRSPRPKRTPRRP